MSTVSSGAPALGGAAAIPAVAHASRKSVIQIVAVNVLDRMLHLLLMRRVFEPDLRGLAPGPLGAMDASVARDLEWNLESLWISAIHASVACLQYRAVGARRQYPG